MSSNLKFKIELKMQTELSEETYKDNYCRFFCCLYNQFLIAKGLKLA